MAPEQKNRGLRKASSLDAPVAPAAKPAKAGKARAKAEEQDFLPTSGDANSRKLRWWADLSVVILTVLLLVSAIFGYRFLKNKTLEPNAKKTVVEYQILLYDVPADAEPESWNEQSVRLSTQAEGSTLGAVTSARWDERAPRAVQVTVRVNAQYKENNGYWVDSLRLMAGVTPTDAKFELGDVSAKGMIIALRAV